MSLQISVFGKEHCGKCAATKNKISHIVQKLGLDGQVQVTHYDMDSEEGIAEGAFRDVLDIPTTIIEKDEEGLARWTGVVPDSKELQDALRVG